MDVWYNAYMTKRNPDAQACKRCGNLKIPGYGQLCAACKGTCKDCGGEVVIKIGSAYKTRCTDCTRIKETTVNCVKCGKVRDGSHRNYCRICYREYSKVWSKNNPEKVRAKNRRNDLKRQYNISPERWAELLSAQDNKCAICGGTEENVRRFHVDHDRTCCIGNSSCGKCVRALLCVRCNVALGMVNDNTNTLKLMISYLENASHLHQKHA